MQVMTEILDIRQADPETLQVAADHLQRGGVIAFPTETVYGLGVIWGHEQACDRLRSLKGRDGSKPFQVLIADPEDAFRLGAVCSAGAQALMKAFWPGGMTLVVPAEQGGTLGLRLPDIASVQQLIRLSGSPIVATSANRAGQPPATGAEEIRTEFAGDLALILDGGTVEGDPSTVVDATGDQPVILRQGALEEDAIQQAWRLAMEQQG